MKPEKQIIAILKACGWKPEREFLVHPDGDSAGYVKIVKGRIDAFFKLPAYLVDLNAMHEAEKTLTPTQRGTMACALTRLVTPGYDWGYADAAQRAEAFLRTLGKWEAV